MYNPYQFLPQGLLGFQDPYADRQQQYYGLMNMPQQEAPIRAPQFVHQVNPIAMQPFGQTLDENAQAGLKKMIGNMKSGDPEYVGQFEPKDNYIPTTDYRTNETPSTYQTPYMDMSPQSAMGSKEEDEKSFRRRMLGLTR